MECPICYTAIKNSAIGSCTHHFCVACLVKWCQFGGTTCPTCKLPITEIRLDKEFDQLNGQGTYLNLPNNCEKITINFEKNNSAGITLENNYGFLNMTTRGPGVVISKIEEKNECYKGGLRLKDTILFINNIPCTDHKQSIDIINKCAIIHTAMVCEILRYKIKEK
jgi:predicted metalloprotease with PDZ domain